MSLPTTGDPNLDKAAIELSAKFVAGIIRSTFSGLATMPEWLKDRIKQHDPFGTEARKYAEAISHRYDRMRVLGMGAPVPIRSIYVRVNILNKVTSHQRHTVEELEEVFNKDRTGFGVVQSTEDGLRVANAESRLIVLGKPGAGKTTFLKWLTLGAIDGRFSTPQLPVFISLKDWADSKKSLSQFIIDEFVVCGFEDPELFVNKLLNDGKARLLLDGFDEVGIRVTDAIREVQTLSDRYPRISIILSCRTAAYNYIFPHFRDAEIADFSKPQVQQFVRNWFTEAKSKGERFLRDLELPKNRGIADLCPTPLLLTLLCLAFEDTQSFPANRAELYKDALDALMKKWDSSRSVIRESAYKNLSLAKKELLLSRLAFGTFEKNRYFIKQDWLEREIADFLQNLKGAPKEVLDYEGERVLKEIEAQHGLLVERAYRIYSFSHLTFQEFFAARYITENTNKSRGPAYLVDKYLLDPRWNEVFVLSTGLLAEADSFLSDIRLKLSGVMKNARLRDLLNRICTLIRADSKVPEPVRRALAVRFVASSLVRVSSSFNPLLHACDELLPDVQKEFGEIVNPELESLKLLQVGLDENRERLDTITQEIAGLHHEQATVFASYIRGTRLLVNCLNVDAYVSMAVRKEIVRGIFEEPWASKLCPPLTR